MPKTLPRLPAPASASEVRDWGFIVLKIQGHGLAADIQGALDTLDKSGTSKDAYITVRAGQNGRYSDFALTDADKPGSHLVRAEGGVQGVDRRTHPMMSTDAIASFLKNTMDKYPARHYFISFDGHSHDIRQVFKPIHDALAETVKERGKKIDVLTFDACFLAQIECASKFADVADVMIGSEDEMSYSRPVDRLAQDVAATPYDAHRLARRTVALNQDLTLSALDLSKTADVNLRMKAFADAVRGVKDQTLLAQMRREIASSQHYFTQGVFRPGPWHNTVDVTDATTRIISNPAIAAGAPQVVAAGRELLKVIKVLPDGFVFAESHQTATSRDKLTFFDVRRSHGLSVYLPVAPHPFRDQYTHFKDSEFDAQTQWEDMIAHLTSSRNPTYVAKSALQYAIGAAVVAAGYVADTVAEHMPHRLH